MMIRSESEIMQGWPVGEPPLVCIVCVTYNHELFIGEALSSFLMQETRFPFEILIGEDCSNDNTLAVINGFIRQYPRIIRLLDNKKNLGPSFNFTRSIKEAKTTYIAYCEGDDYWTTPDKLQIQVDFLQKNHEYALVCHDVEVVNQTRYYAPVRKPYESFRGGRFTTREILLGHFIPTPSLVFRTSALKFPGWFSSCRSGDIALELILSLSGPGHFLPKKMAVYRQHDDGVTKKNRLPPCELLDKNLHLFRAFDELSLGKFTAFVHLRLAKIQLIYAVGRLKAFALRLFIIYCWRAISCFFRGIILSLIKNPEKVNRVP